MEVVNITNARKNLFNLVEEAVQSSRPVRIASKTGDVVLVSAADWESIEETLYLYSVPGLVREIMDARETPVEARGTEEDIGWDIG